MASEFLRLPSQPFFLTPDAGRVCHPDLELLHLGGFSPYGFLQLEQTYYVLPSEVILPPPLYDKLSGI